jgi:RNA-binding motif protein, X-linked 2
MFEYLVTKRKEEKALKKAKKIKSKSRHKNETPAERQARKEKKKEKKERRARKGKSEGMKGVEDLLNSLGGRDFGRPLSRSPSRTRNRSLSPVHDRHRDHSLGRSPANRGSPNRPHQYSDNDRRSHGREPRSRRFTEYD